MRRRLALTFSVACALASGMGVDRVHAADGKGTDHRPNILFIYTDDQSHRTLGCYPEAPRWVRTPHIDRLAEQGVRFTYAYGQAWCAPSRASVMTGLQLHRIRGLHLKGTFHGHYDPKVCRFWPAVLRQAGYHTAMIGKWHITFDSGDGRDWDYSVVWQQGDRRGDWYNDQLISINGGPKKTMQGYSTDVYTGYAVDYISREHEKPWFMWLCYNAPHLPNTVPPRYRNRYDGVDVPVPDDIFGPRPDKPRYLRDFTMFRRTGSMEDIRVKNGYPFCPYPIDTLPDFVRGYHRLVCALDEGVGKILEALETTGQLDRTLIVYTSDQGFAWGQHGYANKSGPHEACMRMPLIVRLPGRVVQGKVCDHPVSLVDLPPTFFALAEVELPWEMDGHSLLPLLQKPSAEWKHPVLVEHFFRAIGTETDHPLQGKPQRHGIPWWISLRQGKYKYIRTLVADEIEELYELEADPQELRNLALSRAHRDLLADYRQRMVDELRRTNAGLLEHLPGPRLSLRAPGAEAGR